MLRSNLTYLDSQSDLVFVVFKLLLANLVADNEGVCPLLEFPDLSLRDINSRERRDWSRVNTQTSGIVKELRRTGWVEDEVNLLQIGISGLAAKRHLV